MESNATAVATQMTINERPELPLGAPSFGARVGAGARVRGSYARALCDDGRIACNDSGVIIRWCYLRGHRKLPYSTFAR